MSSKSECETLLSVVETSIEMRALLVKNCIRCILL